MERTANTQFAGLEFVLFPDGSAYVASINTLFIADVHLGKSGHFRKWGIPAPVGIHTRLLGDLRSAIARHPGAIVVFLGDLLHSDQNHQTKELAALLGTFPSHEFHLVLGNHDRDVPAIATLKQHKQLQVGDIICLHEPPGSNFDRNIPFDHKLFPELPILCGHLHAGVALKGRGRARTRIKAFYFGERIGVLPAFGTFTGAHALQEQGQYFGIVENTVVAL